jgi:signal transduction histidine kinase
MPRPLRLLVAEDCEDDYEILLRELRGGGYEPSATRVASAESFAAALARPWDLIVTDWCMPGWSGAAVLELLAVQGIDAPCIVVSGTLGEEAALQALRGGARDFLSKDKPHTVVPAVRRVLALPERRAIDVDRRQRELIARMSHELRTPLNAIIGFAELLHDGRVDPASPQHREFLGDILASGRHLLAIVEDALAREAERAPPDQEP